MFATFIDKYNPAVIIKFSNKCGYLEQDFFDNYLKDFRALYERQENFNILIDGRDVENFPISYAMQHATFLIKHKSLTKQYIKKSAIILSNSTMESIINVVLSMYKPESDLIVTRNFREGLMHVLDTKIE